MSLHESFMSKNVLLQIRKYRPLHHRPHRRVLIKRQRLTHTNPPPPQPLRKDLRAPEEGTPGLPRAGMDDTPCRPRRRLVAVGAEAGPQYLG